MGWWSTTMLTTHWTASATGSPPWKPEKTGTTTTPSSWRASTSARGRTNPAILSVHPERLDLLNCRQTQSKDVREEQTTKRLRGNYMGAICLACVFISCSKTKYVTHACVSLLLGVYPFSCTLFMWCERVVTLGKPDGSNLFPRHRFICSCVMQKTEVYRQVKGGESVYNLIRFVAVDIMKHQRFFF